MMVRAKASIRIPTVLSVNEAHRIPACLDGVYSLVFNSVFNRVSFD
jgi:hypothetical protein